MKRSRQVLWVQWVTLDLSDSVYQVLSKAFING